MYRTADEVFSFYKTSKLLTYQSGSSIYESVDIHRLIGYVLNTGVFKTHPFNCELIIYTTLGCPVSGRPNLKFGITGYH